MYVKELQEQVGIWLNHNFPDATTEDQVLIIAEEVGELAHGVLKRKQGIRKNEDHDAAIKDAVGDIVVSVAAFCCMEGIDLYDTIDEVWKQVRERDWTKNSEY